jgi:hypothetical protein
LSFLAGPQLGRQAGGALAPGSTADQLLGGARCLWPRAQQLREYLIDRSIEVGGHFVHEADP